MLNKWNNSGELRVNGLNKTGLHRQEDFNFWVTYRRWKNNYVGALFRLGEFLTFGQPLHTLLRTQPEMENREETFSYDIYNHPVVSSTTGFLRKSANQIVAPYSNDRQFMSGSNFSDIRGLLKVKQSKRFDSCVFLIPRQDYYYHFVVEWLPRIILVKSHFPNVTFISGSNAKYVFDFSEALEINLTLTDENFISPSELLTLETHLDLERRIALLKKEFSSVTNEVGTQTKLFITREGHSRFNLCIENEIRAKLPEDIEVYDPGAFNISEQIGRFRATSELYGLHGGGLTNMIFMAGNTKVVEFFTSRIRSECYRELAKACNLHYSSSDV